MHSREQCPTKYAGNAKHMKRMHKNIVFSLEYQHEVEGSGNAKRHSVREATLSKGINKKDSRRCSDWSRICNKKIQRVSFRDDKRVPLVPYIRRYRAESGSRPTGTVRRYKAIRPKNLLPTEGTGANRWRLRKARQRQK